MKENIKPCSRPRVGLYSAGLKAYWAQFPGMRERLEKYGKFVEEKMTDCGGEVHNFGMVEDADTGLRAGAFFAERHVDIVFCHNATYVTSDSVLSVHQVCPAPVVILNLQPAPQLNYAKTTTGEWLAQCAGCSVPELTNALHRAGIRHHVVNGLLGLAENPAEAITDEVSAHRPEARRAWEEIAQYIGAARVKRALRGARFGYLGNNYSGMLDLYSDFTMVQAQTGLHVDILEMCDLDQVLAQVTQEEKAEKHRQVQAMFQISGDSDADPLARKPTEAQMDWSCLVAAAQEKLVRANGLDALAYYYHGAAGNAYERLQSGFIVGHSLLTARGVPCAGEGDLKTAVAMKICDVLGVGGSFCEIVIIDYENGTILVGHDGPFHIAISDGKPILRGMGLYHGKRGSGVSVEAKVRSGPVTLLGCTQTHDGRLKFIISEGEAVNGPIMQIGNTQTPVRFSRTPDAYMDAWFAEAPTHHFALSVGHNGALFAKTADLLQIPYVVL
ncbi:MAG: L-fucose/L-arabinose isomerase family protein [Oscillospiraceae bacterium]|jgi:L-arabinose isomerase|nr:L-fucose/L-arabinose isomerase family protein [Oscillospiraceae bacterium]